MNKVEVEFHSKAESGNVYFVLGKCLAELRKQHRIIDANIMRDRVYNTAKSYKGALAIMNEYVELKDLDN